MSKEKVKVKYHEIKENITNHVNKHQLSTEDIVIDDLSRDYFSLYKRIERYGKLKRSKPELANKLLNNRIEKIIPSFHKLKFSFRNLSELTDRSISWYSTTFKELGIKANSNIAHFPNHKITYTCNINAFQKWDSEMAYWLGFIWADGYVSIKKNKHIFRIALKIEDKEHLLKLKSFLQTDSPVVETKHKINNKKYPTVTLSIYRLELIESLFNLGLIVDRSQKNNDFPNIPKQFVWHFMRGFFDGDGCIQRPQKCSFYLSGWSLSFCGSKNNMLFIQKIIQDETGLEYSICRNGKSKVNFTLYRTGPAVFPVLKLLYPSEFNLGLERKISLSKFLINTYDEKIKSGLQVANRNDGLRFI